MKQTAVDQLVSELRKLAHDKNHHLEMGDIRISQGFIDELEEQFKEMERQQIIESYCQGCFDISLNKNIFPRETSEQYYKETFNK